MAVTNRPLSPHLQVYKPQMSSAMSITHRATGIALSLGTLLLAYWLVAAASGDAYFDTAQALVGSIFGRLCLFGWTVALFYHMCNGIRHLFWDLGKGLDLPTATKSGWATLICAALLTIVTWVLGYSL